MAKPRIEKFYITFGRRVAAARQKQGWSAEFLGSLLEPPVTRAHVSHIELGKVRVFAHTYIRLCTLLHLD